MSVNNEICLEFDFGLLSLRQTARRYFSYSPACPRALSRAAAGRPPPRPLPLPPYARCRGLRGYLRQVLRRRRARTRYAHPFSSLLCETEHRNPNLSYLAICIRICSEHKCIHACYHRLFKKKKILGVHLHCMLMCTLMSFYLLRPLLLA